MFRHVAKSLILFALLPISAARAERPCQLCGAGEPEAAATAPKKAIHIEINAMLDFSKAAHTEVNQGSVEIDSRTGERRFVNLVGLGGAALKGTARITGEPFRLVRISMPTQAIMRSTQGATADVTHIVTDLPATPVIGADGTLTFNFGGKLTVRGGAAGDFHGQIAIRADYQ
jgi:hypothetical protein